MKLFWKELKQADQQQKCRFGRGTVWASLDKVEVDTTRLEHLFESKAKELTIAKVTGSLLKWLGVRRQDTDVHMFGFSVERTRDQED